MTQPGTPSESSEQPDTKETQPQEPESTEPVEKKGYASALLAYRVINNLGEVIATQVKKRLEQQQARLLLVSEPEQALGGMPLKEIQGQIKLTKPLFTTRNEANEQLLKRVRERVAVELVKEEPSLDVAETAGAALITAIGGITGPLTDVVNLFRSQYTITEQAVAVKDSAVLSSVAGSLKKAGFDVFVPNFSYSSQDSEILTDLTDLSKQAADLQTQRDELASWLAKAGEKDESGKLAKLAATLGKELLATIPAAVRDTDAALLLFAGFRTSWTTPPQGQTQTKLEKALLRERTEKLHITHLLWLSNLSSGGETTNKENFFQRLAGTERIGFMGGAAVGFVLADKDGNILDGNTYDQYGVTGGRLNDYMGQDFMRVVYTPDIPISQEPNVEEP